MDPADERRTSRTYLGLALGGLAVVILAVVLVPTREESPSGAQIGAERFDAPDPTEEEPVNLDGYRQVLSRDQIAPVYSPEFVDGNQIDWSDETLVIGVAGGDEAKAYPVSHLNAREIVNDEIDGEPILVTW